MRKIIVALIVMSLLLFGCATQEPVLNETVEDITVDQATEEIISNTPEVQPETETDVTQAQKVEPEEEVEEVETEESNEDSDTEEESNAEEESEDTETEGDAESEKDEDSSAEEETDDSEDDDKKSDSILKGQLNAKVSKLKKLEELLAKPAFKLEEDPIEELDSELDLFDTIGYDSDQGDLEKDMEDKYFN